MTWKMLSAMALLASGCRTPDSVLLATLDCDPGTPPSYSIKVALSEPGGHDDTKIFPASPSGPLAFPTSLALIIPRDRSGILDLAFLALDAEKIGGQNLDETEEIEVVLKPFDELIRMAKNGELFQSMQVSAVFFALAYWNRII